MNTEKEPWRVEAGRLGGLKSGESRRAKAQEKKIRLIEEGLAEAILSKKAPETLILRRILKEEWDKDVSCTDILKLITNLLPRIQALASIEGFQIRDIFKPPNLENKNRKHPFGLTEE